MGKEQNARSCCAANTLSVGVRGIEPSFFIVSGLLPLFSILIFGTWGGKAA